jgi:hypothetical protein
MSHSRPVRTVITVEAHATDRDGPIQVARSEIARTYPANNYPEVGEPMTTCCTLVAWCRVFRDHFGVKPLVEVNGLEPSASTLRT